MKRPAEVPRRLTLLIGLLGSACTHSAPSGPDADSSDVGAVTVTRAEPTTLPQDSTFDLRVFGSGFDEDSRVVLTLNGAPTSKVRTNATRFVSAAELSANITTAGDAPGGPYDILVGGNNGKQGVGTELVDLKARVFGIDPSGAGPTDVVTISGINFGSDRSKVAVKFDHLGAFIQAVSNTRIVAYVPTMERGGAKVQVFLRGVAVGAPLNFQVLPLGPVIDSFSPPQVAPGERIEIIGLNFGSRKEDVTVTFDGLPASVVSVTSTRIEVIVPIAVEPGAASLEVGIGERQSVRTTTTILPLSPEISAVGPSVIRAGGQLFIFGSHFGSDVENVSAEVCRTVLFPGGDYYGWYYGPFPVPQCVPVMVLAVSDTKMTVGLPGGLEADNWTLEIAVTGARQSATVEILVL